MALLRDAEPGLPALLRDAEPGLLALLRDAGVPDELVVDLGSAASRCMKRGAQRP